MCLTRSTIFCLQTRREARHDPKGLSQCLQGVLRSMGCWCGLSPSPTPGAERDHKGVEVDTSDQAPDVAVWLKQIDALMPNRFTRCARMLIDWGCSVDARWASECIFLNVLSSFGEREFCAFTADSRRVHCGASVMTMLASLLNRYMHCGELRKIALSYCTRLLS